ncbi:MAG: squalene/phytoene synthase family protein [Candidatus Marinimicrobia bacterium]|nr:squalene/phytoene synthase family protein [Candidatus Neomarinimicrobiota bacterium]
MNELKLCWNILPDVSRSFSLCIKLLPKPLDEEVMISYLIFRVIDTIEDSSAKLEYKKVLFDDLIEVLSSKDYNNNITLKSKKNLMKKLKDINRNINRAVLNLPQKKKHQIV